MHFSFAQTAALPEINILGKIPPKNHTLLIGYQYLTTWVPGKKTLSYTYKYNPPWSWEGEYAWSTLSTGIVGIDLGGITEKRTSLLGRRFVGNSFHWIIGGYHQHLDAKLGGELKTPVVGSVVVEGVGLALGFGNRWTFNNGFTLGADWLRINVPLRQTKNENQVLKNVSDKSSVDDVKTVISAINRVPTFILLGLNLGYSF